MNYFFQSTQETLGYYVYFLINPAGNKIFDVGKGRRNNYKFEKKFIIKDSKDSNNCIFLLLVFLRMKIDKDTDKIKRLKKIAKDLSVSEFDRYWGFVDETLSESDISGEYKAIKKEKLSFIQRNILAKC